MTDDGLSAARAQSDAGGERLPPYQRTTTKPASVTSQLIAAAVSLVGAPVEVRTHMRCTENHFLDYCAGVKEPSPVELERLITLIIREQGRIIAQNRNLLQQLRMDKKTSGR
jgi:hypothetical protein